MEACGEHQGPLLADSNQHLNPTEREATWSVYLTQRFYILGDRDPKEGQSHCHLLTSCLLAFLE